MQIRSRMRGFSRIALQIMLTIDLPKLVEQHPVSPPLQPLAVLAARKGNGEILQFCLEKGAVFDWNLERSTHFGANSPAMNNILFAEKQKLSGGTSAKSDSKWNSLRRGYRKLRLWYDGRKDSFSVVITRTVDLCFRKAFRAKGKGSLMEEEYIDHLIAYFGGV